MFTSLLFSLLSILKTNILIIHLYYAICYTFELRYNFHKSVHIAHRFLLTLQLTVTCNKHTSHI